MKDIKNSQKISNLHKKLLLLLRAQELKESSEVKLTQTFHSIKECQNSFILTRGIIFKKIKNCLFGFKIGSLSADLTGVEFTVTFLSSASQMLGL